MDEKDRMRRAMLAARSAHVKAATKAGDEASSEASGEASNQANALAAHAAKLKGQIIATYMPLGGEIDPRPLMAVLRQQGAGLALPVCVDEEAPMVFRRYKPGDGLLPDAMGIAAPRATAQQVTPDIVLLPLLAFDGAGRRLGRGGGFYDRTLAKLRDTTPCRFLGLAFDMQMVDKCPTAPHDEPLHGVLTPSIWHEFNKD